MTIILSNEMRMFYLNLFMDHYNTVMYWEKSLLYLIFIIIGADCCTFYKWNPLISKTNLHFSILILARGGSKGIELKNIAKVGNIPLIRIILKQVKIVNGIDSIWISTDHLKIAQVAEKENVNIHWRSTASATDNATSIDGVKDFLEHHPEVDILGLIQCTSPFIDAKYVQRAIHFMKRGGECVFSVTRSHKLLWKEFNNKVVPFNFNPNKRPRRQDWTGNLEENGMFYFATRKLLQNNVFQSNK